KFAPSNPASNHIFRPEGMSLRHVIACLSGAAMRSDLVFLASDKVTNRFELFHLSSSSSRTMFRSSVVMHLSINHARDGISGQSVPVSPVEMSRIEQAGASVLALDSAL